MDMISFRELNFFDPSEVEDAALHFANVPFGGNPNFHTSRHAIRKHAEWLSYNQEKIYCLVAYEGKNMIGMHLLYFDPHGRNRTCFIKALWISSDFKKCGIGEKLQALGEEWARERGVQKIVTHVMTKNPRMIQANLGHGYKPVKLELEKKLA